MRILDIFSGAGGFSLGFEKAGNNTVIAVDINPFALETFKYNFPESEVICGDITEESIKKKIVKLSKEKKVDMIIGGPPCQGFSLQGKKLGLKDERNFLFLEFVNLVKRIRPKFFVLENVKNMINAEQGYFIDLIVEEFSKLGYYVDYKVINAKDVGVPQNRERAFVVGSLESKIEFKIKEKKTCTVRDAISDLAYLESGEGEDESDYRYKAKTSYQRLMRKKSTKLFNHKATNHKKVALDKLKLIPKECGKEHLPNELKGNQKFSSTWGRLRWDGISPTIDTRFDTPSNGTNSHPELNRAITPREAARLQSFPDSFKFLGNKTEICKQIGNAVPPMLAEAVANSINLGQLKKIKNDAVTLLNSDAYVECEDTKHFDHIITDPPYNISKKNNLSTLSGKRQGLDFGEWDKGFDLTSWLDIYIPNLKDGGTIIIFCSYLFISHICEKLESLGCDVKDVIRWIKTNPMPRNINRRYVLDCEFAIWAVKPGKKWIFNNENDGYKRAEIKTPIVSGNERVNHPTQKSLKLMEEIIKTHTNEGDVVFDPFMGSGTTGVAALNLGRKFIGIEKNEEYFKLAKKRIIKE